MAVRASPLAAIEARAAELEARILLGVNRIPEARSAIEHASSLQECPYRDDINLRIRITAIRVAFAGDRGLREAIDGLEKVLQIARVQGDLSVEFEAALAKDEVELQGGEIVAARRDLKERQRQAAQKHFGLVELRAKSLLSESFMNRQKL